MSQASARLGSAAASLSSRVSLPLLGLAAVSVNLSGEMESLQLAMRTTFENAGRSAEAAALEVEALRKSAMAPGLDFPQAIKASIRMQNVGYSAESARRIIEQLANAIAMSGGTAEDLDGVTRQFAQMSAKGRVLQEDLTIIQERMPAISKVMLDAFGTVSAEALRNMGVNAETFIEKVTAGMEKLPRVQGGLANSLVNAAAAMRGAGASVGDTFAKTLGLSGKIDAFATAVGGMAKQFENMDEGTKRAVVGVGIFAAALGPALYAGRTLLGGLNGIADGMLKLRGLYVAMTAANGGLAASFRALDMATKMTILGATIGVILAAAVAVRALRKDTSDAAAGQKELDDASLQAQKNIVQEKLAAEKLTATLRDETKTRAEKNAAIKELSALAPDIFGNLNLEKEGVEGVNRALDKYIVRIKRRAELTVLNQKLVEQEQALYDIEARRKKGPGVTDYLKAFTGRGLSAGQAQNLGLNSERDDLLKTRDAIAQKINILEKEADATDAAVVKAKAYVSATNEQKKAAKELSDLQRDNELENSLLRGQSLFPAVKQDAPGRSEAFGMELRMPDLPLENALDPAMDQLEAFAIKGQTVAGVFSDSMGQVREAFMKTGESVSSVSLMLSDAFVNASETGASSMKGFAREALSASAKIIKSWVMQGVAATVSKALSSVPFPINLIAATTAGIASGALFNKALGALKIPALAEGGLAYAPTLAMVGDNPGASSDPEVIAPFSKLERLMGGGGAVIPTLRFDGRDMVLALRRAERDLNRV